MFNLNPKPTFSAPVGLSVPGLEQPLDVVFTFKHKTRAGVSKWMDAWVKSRTTTPESSHEVLAEVIEGWELKKDGEPVPFTPSALAELMETYTPAGGEIADAYLLEITRAKRKNS